jgi:hypothetical protein
MNRATPSSLRQLALLRFGGAAMLLTLAACAHLTSSNKTATENSSKGPVAYEQTLARAQLSIGYSLLYQEADGIPKLKWIFLFKKTPGEMGRLTDELISYYQQLAETMRRLSKDYPGMRIDAQPMSEIESEERKSIGEDLAKDFAPLVGKTGMAFEREALLMFYNSLNEQRHLTRVMAAAETDPGLREFLQTTEAQLDERYAKVGNLLNERYFTH